jgi:mono/diheme cytochrome c family protein
VSRAFKALLLIAVLLLAAAWAGKRWLAGGARKSPGALEAAVARRLRSFLIPADAKARGNPITPSEGLLQEAAKHFADHCASCHANDGSGNTEIGRNLNPPAPDMRLAATQALSDGELYYIVQNGVRWTGMPAWGTSDDDPDSWKLVLFIRHLPGLTASDLREMERFNPKSTADREEEEAEDKFLNPEPASGTQKDLKKK